MPSPQAFAIATPTTEEMTRVGIVGGVAGVTGAVEGVVLTMAPKLGALEVPFTWGTMLAVPVLGAGVALLTKGFISDAGLGIAAAGAAILGQTLPVMLQEFTLAGRKGLTAEQRAALAAGHDPKLLGQGAAAEAARRAVQAARVGIEF